MQDNGFSWLEFSDGLNIITLNQCVVFVKTFNSLHSVPPMRGKGSKAMRRTLTINIETPEF